MRIVTNTRRFPVSWTASTGEQGTSVYAASAGEMLAHLKARDAVLLVNCDPDLAYRTAFAMTVSPWRRRPLISVDLVLRRPRTAAARLMLPFKRALLTRFDHHLHYFRDLAALEQVFGIGPNNSSYVPFKPNLALAGASRTAEGDYVLCFGRSLRDYDSFFAAVERLPYPAAIAQPDVEAMRAHGTRFSRPLTDLPRNVTVLPDDNSTEAQIRILSGARLVVLPIVKASLVASGIGTCLNAMLLGRCVIGSEGPGMSDIFTDEILTVPAENPAALARMIQRAWEDEGLRARTAEAGRRYARSLGGEPELYQRIIDRIAEWMRSRTSS